MATSDLRVRSAATGAGKYAVTSAKEIVAGQWRSPTGAAHHEQSKVLLLVHPDTTAARQSIQDVIGAYLKTFEQESVLWESARVCVAG